MNKNINNVVELTEKDLNDMLCVGGTAVVITPVWEITRSPAIIKLMSTKW